MPKTAILLIARLWNVAAAVFMTARMAMNAFQGGIVAPPADPLGAALFVWLLGSFGLAEYAYQHPEKRVNRGIYSANLVIALFCAAVLVYGVITRPTELVAISAFALATLVPASLNFFLLWQARLRFDALANTAPPPTFMATVLNGGANIVIGFSVFAQVVALLVAANPGAERTAPLLVAFFEAVRWVIFPGMFLAFIKFLLNVIRSFKSAAAGAKAVGYLIALVLPPLLPMLFQVGPYAKRADPVEMARRSRAAPPSKDFLAGRDWARVNMPARRSECQGSIQFIKGCRNYYLEKLQAPKPLGESKYVGMTTAECIVEVNAEHEVRKREYLENGNTRGAEVNRQRHWLPELKDCENYDKHEANAFMPHAMARLRQAIEKHKTGQVLTEDEKAAVLADFGEMAKVKDQPYKAAYLELSQEYSELIGRSGPYRLPGTAYPKIACDEYQSKITEMRKMDAERVAAMQALERPNGVITNGARHSALNSERIAMLWDVKFYTDGAKAAGCAIK